MEILEGLKNILNSSESYIHSKNFYFENHDCKNDGQKKIVMNYIVRMDDNKKIVKVGFCNQCKTLVYHEDFDSKK